MVANRSQMEEQSPGQPSCTHICVGHQKKLHTERENLAVFLSHLKGMLILQYYKYPILIELLYQVLFCKEQLPQNGYCKLPQE